MSDLKKIQQQLSKLAVTENRAFFEKMVPGKQKIYGVKTPQLNEIVKQYKEGSFTLAEELWTSGALEEKMIAIKIMEKKGKNDPARLLKLFRKFSGDIDNWAVCDGLGMQFLRGIVRTHRNEIFLVSKKLSRSKNMWQRRLSLVMVEWYTRKSESRTEIARLVKSLEKDPEYYVRKAIVWIKKNLEKGT